MNERSESQTQAPRVIGSEGLPVPAAAVRDPLPVPQEPASGSAEVAQPTTGGNASVRADLDTRGEFASFAHQYIRDYIALADQKATFFFTGATALLAFLYNQNVSDHWLKPLMEWNILDTIAFVAMAALAAGALLALLVIIPRTPGSRRGFLFWQAIAEYDTGRQYSDELWRLSGPSLVQIKAEHCYELARVCRRKYWMLRSALWTGAVGLAGSLFVFLFL